MAYSTTDQLMAEMSDHWPKNHESNFYKLLDIFNSHEEALSDLTEKIADWRMIDKAEGSTLDLVGQQYGVPRIDSDDGFYRFMIKMKQLTAKSNGTVDDIARTVALSLDIDIKKIRVERTDHKYHIKVSGIAFEYADDTRKTKVMLTRLKEAIMLGTWLDNIEFEIYTKTPILHVGAGVFYSEFQQLKIKEMMI